MSEYILKAKEFLEKNNTTVTINFKEVKKNPWRATNFSSNWLHNIYRVTIRRNKNQFSFDFTDSAYNYTNKKEPTEYDVLACLTKYDVGTFEDFCSDFGYEVWAEYPKRGYNKESEKIYNAIVKEYNNVMRLFGDCIEELEEIN